MYGVLFFCFFELIHLKSYWTAVTILLNKRRGIYKNMSWFKNVQCHYIHEIKYDITVVSTCCILYVAVLEHDIFMEKYLAYDVGLSTYIVNILSTILLI